MQQNINELLSVVATVSTFVFAIGITIYTFQFGILRESAEKGFVNFAGNKHYKLKFKVLNLFWIGAVTIFYSLICKLLIIRNLFEDGCVFLLGIVSMTLLFITFVQLYKLLYEIGLKEYE